MANSRVELACSLIPIVVIDAVGNQSAESEQIEADIGKSLGASGNVEVGQTAHTTVGYSAGAVAYQQATTGSKAQVGADATAYDVVYIKNVGNVWSSSTVLGAVSTLELDVYIEITAGSAWIKIATLPAGVGFYLPKFPSQGASKGIFVQPATGSDDLAVEIAFIT